MSLDINRKENPDIPGEENQADQADQQTQSKPKTREFHNGWTPHLEDLITDWADKAACARWMHERTGRLYTIRDRAFNIPVIILSGLIAGANFALNSVVGDNKENQKWAQLGLGGASLTAGIIQTLMNFFKFAQGSEAHRVAALHWGKFNRLLCIEMRLHPDKRAEATTFLKMFRAELDRLIEQSPEIPQLVINEFNTLFKHNTDLVKPEITGILEHTEVYKDQGERLKRIAAEATIALHYKRGIIKQLVEDEILTKTRTSAREEAINSAREFLRQEREKQGLPLPLGHSQGRTARRASIVEQRKDERKKEIQSIATSRAGTVAELRARFKQPIQAETLPGQLPQPQEQPQEQTENTFVAITIPDVQPEIQPDAQQDTQQSEAIQPPAYNDSRRTSVQDEKSPS